MSYSFDGRLKRLRFSGEENDTGYVGLKPEPSIKQE